MVKYRDGSRTKMYFVTCPDTFDVYFFNGCRFSFEKNIPVYLKFVTEELNEDFC